MGSITKIAVANLAVAACLVLAIEGGARLLEGDRASADHKRFRLRRPEPYVGSPYFSGEFIDESFAQPGGWTTPPGTRIVLPNEFRGRWFNVRDGKRVTAGQPHSHRHRVLLFGGSTVYGSEVPDDQTIASHLQALINQSGDSAVVENFGATSVHVAQQLERLERDVHLLPTDVVVFYDGVNDVIQRVYYENPDGWIANEAKTAPFVVRGVRGAALHSAFFRWVDRAFLTRTDFSKAGSLVVAASHDYGRALDAVDARVTSAGATFFHFLQPNLFTKTSPNEYERWLAGSGGVLSPVGLESAIGAAYPMMKAELRGRPFSNELTAVLDGTARSPYLDFCHVTEEANGLVARAIYSRIRAALR